MSNDGSSDRLPSFKGPRDLTLAARGGSGAPRSKRIFTPNIPPKRDRGSSNAPCTGGQPSSSSGSRPSTSQPARPNVTPPSRGRGRGRGKREFIQSASVFAEGIGDPLAVVRKAVVPSTKERSSAGRYGGGGRGGVRPSPNVTKASLNELIKVEEDEPSDQRVFGGDQYELEIEEKDDPNVPIVVPLTSYVPEYYIDPLPVPQQEIPVVQTVGGVRIKSEQLEPGLVVPETPPLDPTSFPHVVAAAPDGGTLFLLQLPDQLPVLEQTPESNDARSERQTSNPNTAANAKGTKAQKSDSKLTKDIRTLPEGYIGKIQIMASGKTRFILGENIFEMETGKPIGFRQDLVSIDVEDEKLTALGPIAHKFVCTPDIDALLRDIL